MNGVLRMKAHPKYCCIPIFKTKKLAKDFMEDNPYEYEIIPLSVLNNSSYSSNITAYNSVLIDFGEEGVIEYKEGKLNSAESFLKYLV